MRDTTLKLDSSPFRSGPYQPWELVHALIKKLLFVKSGVGDMLIEL